MTSTRALNRAREFTVLARQAFSRHITTLWAAGAATAVVVLTTCAPASAAVDITVPDQGATPGGSVRLHADDLDAGGAVTVSLGDDTLVSLRANGDGSLDSQIALPSDLTAGEYALAVEGAGLERSVNTVQVSSGPQNTGPASGAAATATSSDVVLAIPPGGGSANTAGTTSTVSPSSVAQGGSLTWKVGGYPAGETVYAKIDDGEYRGTGITQGSDIVNSATIAADGSASGSFTIPSDLAAGAHTLRFLATSADSKGYTHRSQEFTVTAATAGGATPSSTSTTAATTATSSSTAAASPASSTAATLAKTGAPVLVTAAVGAVAIAIGGSVLRRRNRLR